MAPTASCTWPETRASSSCTERVIARIFLPKKMVVTTIGGTIASISSVRWTSMTNSITSAPAICTAFRSAIDSSLPTTPSTTVTSDASRPTSSPLRRSWNQDIGSVTMRSNTSPRRSVTTRSPSQLIE